MCYESQMFILPLFSLESLLCGKCHHGHTDRFVNPVIDNSCSLTNDVKIMSFSYGDECHSQEIVFSDHLAHIQSIMEALHTMNWRAASGVLFRENAFPALCKISCNFGDYVRQMVSDSRLVEVQFQQQFPSLHPPFPDNFVLALPEYLRQMLNCAEVL